jgi:hypothetical protein
LDRQKSDVIIPDDHVIEGGEEDKEVGLVGGFAHSVWF